MSLLQELYNNKQTSLGTYAGVHFSPATISNIQQYIKNNNIPNPVSSNKFHTTLLYSRKHLPDYKALGKYDLPFIGSPEHLEVWKTQSGDKNCLVLKYDCADLCERHERLMNEHGATWDFPNYIPHITLSYDVGDLSADDLLDPKEIGDIEIVEEYGEDLNDNWASTSTE